MYFGIEVSGLNSGLYSGTMYCKTYRLSGE